MEASPLDQSLAVRSEQEINAHPESSENDDAPNQLVRQFLREELHGIDSTRGVAKVCLLAPALMSSRSPIPNKCRNTANGFEKLAAGNNQKPNCSDNAGGEGGIRTHGRG
jgi:hypothetical protein